MQDNEDRKDEVKQKDPLSEFFAEHTHPTRNKDDLIDIKVGNPLKRITELLEDIKKQKAFSFTLKGSLGIMGVFLALSVVGIFGGGQLLCEKGVQSEVGVVKVLSIQETDPAQGIPIFAQLMEYFMPRTTHARTVLIQSDGNVIRIPYTNKVDITSFVSVPVVVTGNYDACGNSLSITDSNGVDTYTPVQ